jgi:type VI secretion system secreted protein Hcp
MAVDAFLKLGDIKGESVSKGKEEQIDVLAWSWGLSQSGTLHMGSGGGAGKVNVQDLNFTKYVDAATPNLIKACCDGKHIDEAVLTFRKAGGTPLEYLVLTLTEVMVTMVSTGGSSGEDRFTENVVLNFAKFKLSYQPQDSKGAKKGGAIEAEYHIAENA